MTADSETERLRARISELEEIVERQSVALDSHVCPHPLVVYVKVSLFLVLCGILFVVGGVLIDAVLAWLDS